jgi:hypothetical protein
MLGAYAQGASQLPRGVPLRARMSSHQSNTRPTHQCFALVVSGHWCCSRRMTRSRQSARVSTTRQWHTSIRSRVLQPTLHSRVHLARGPVSSERHLRNPDSTAETGDSGDGRPRRRSRCSIRQMTEVQSHRLSPPSRVPAGTLTLNCWEKRRGVLGCWERRGWCARILRVIGPAAASACNSGKFAVLFNCVS